MTIPEWPHAVWQWLIRHEIISGFLVTMLGVSAAFWLTGLGEQKALHSATRQRLHIVVLESQYNGAIAKKAMDACANPSAAIIVEKPDTALTAAALEDANILAFLPHHKVSVLWTYVSAVATLNEAIEVHQSVLESANYRPPPVEADTRRNVRSNAASVLANAIVVREELNAYFDERTYDHAAMQRIENRLKYLKEEALSGKVSLSKEE